MNVDRYTKFVLTVVAVCLCMIVLRDIEIIPEANAQIAGSDVVRVRVVNDVDVIVKKVKPSIHIYGSVDCN